MTKKILSVIVLTLLLFVSSKMTANATVTACDASVDFTSVRPSSTYDIRINVVNSSGPEQITWVKITRPSANFTINSTSSSGWGSPVPASDITFTGGTIDFTYAFTFVINVTTGSSEADSANWAVQASSNADGSSAVTCSGSLGTSISASASGSDTTAPALSNLVVSDVTDSSVKITWDTDESSTTSVDYGTTNSYGSNKSDSTSTTSHSISIDSLSANTTYHYNAKSADAAGNTGESGDNTFATAKTGSTGTTTTGTVTTTTKTVIKILKDTTPPSVYLTTSFDKPYAAAPKISGSASDDSGISRIEYSIDDGKNWLPADLSSQFAKSTTFSFTPSIIDDDDYKIQIRATDPTGNVGTSTTYTLTIDRLPPTVGISLISVGPQILEPAAGGIVTTVAGLEQKITVSAVGGPNNIDIVAGDESFPLIKNSESGLWSGSLKISTPGTYKLRSRAKDGAGNVTEKQLQTLIVIKGGTITSPSGIPKNATIALYYKEPYSQTFVVWDAKPYSQQNPQKVNADGQYNFFIPPGTYYLEVKAPLYKTLRTNIFTTTQNLPINADFTLKKSFGLRFGPFVISLPDIFDAQAPINPSTTTPNEVKTGLEGKEFPNFNLTENGKPITNLDLRGKPLVITFLASWSPYTSEQIATLNKLAVKENIRLVAIFPQESVSKIDIFKKRGAYSLSMAADPDGALISPLNLTSLPTHIFVNRKGVIGAVKTGVLNETQLMENLVN